MSEGVITIVTNAQRESRGMLRWKTGGVDVTHLKVLKSQGWRNTSHGENCQQNIPTPFILSTRSVRKKLLISHGRNLSLGWQQKIVLTKMRTMRPQNAILEGRYWSEMVPVRWLRRSAHTLIILGQISLWLSSFFSSECLNARKYLHASYLFLSPEWEAWQNFRSHRSWVKNFEGDYFSFSCHTTSF